MNSDSPDVVAPPDEAGVAAVIAEAAAGGAPLLVRGNGSKLGMLRPVQAARSLSVRNLTGITLRAPKELVIGVRAGTALTELEAAVAADGQYLVAEPPDLTALLGTQGAAPQTVGGIVAANLSGPRRVAWGAMRDHVMGVRAVNGSGETIRSGGRVLKNVTGLDLCKLLTGSHGTLAVLTEIVVKVLPKPETSGSLLLSGLDATPAVAMLSAALGSPYGVSGAAYLPAPAAALVAAVAPAGSRASATLIRIEDFATSVAYRLDRLRADLAGLDATVAGTIVLLDDAASRAAWRAVRDAVPLPAAASDAIWRVSVRPSAGPGVLETLSAAGLRGFLDWGGGLVWLAGPPDAATHDRVCRAARAAGGTWTLLRAPEALRVAVEVVPPEPAPLAAIAARVKAAFDPRGILNPGRFGAGR
jgi:glycolate oxidase FAD binding subunit